ncbi:MAG: mannose-1-phosphate guanylyltransferase [Bacteroidetes bacterium GWE2_29_8]|nr:MAG: mannose-1-phosphate guanylyltransferase [Bacteroidetes bacterium GWE2_29_8]OFY18748.1 MAG: mannose-1-phosphate guanylyltransferase [Bacteroidetes bacterium GWF2_29_10]
MKNKNNFCIIMAGGIGARFWPMSKTSHPKQFIDILGTGETLIQQTFNRFKRIIEPENIFIVTNIYYKNMVMSQLPELSESNILCEPNRRNTAPCIAYASYKIQQINPNANVVVSPSDHIILKEDKFLNTIASALDATKKNNWLVTLGITPSRPDTGYGYIQFTDEINYSKNPDIKKVKTFTEKPSLEIAKSFMESGDFLWNAGIFIWNVKSIISAMDDFLPEISIAFKDGMNKYNTTEESEYVKWAYSVCKNISIDYGVMEKAANVYVLKSEFGWSDLGTWRSLFEYSNKNEVFNSVKGKNVLTYDTKNCIINVPDDKLVVIDGLENYIVAESDNVLLICSMSEEQKIKQFVNDVKVLKGDQYV